jgi:hypothetical protein
MPRVPLATFHELVVRPRDANDGQHDLPPSPVPDAVRVKNRRKRYLDLHPEYFGPQLELAGVQLSVDC